MLTFHTVALREVAEFVAGQTLTVDVETVTFSQHFPRRVYLILCVPASSDGVNVGGD